MTAGADRRYLLDASAFITLAAIDCIDLLDGLSGPRAVPDAVAAEIQEDPAASALEGAEEIERVPRPSTEAIETARRHLGVPATDEPPGGDVALLAAALESAATVVITDDKPLRKACKALGIPVAGSIGVIISAVERGDIDAEAAMAALVAMDEVGARLSARLLQRAEGLIEDAAERD